MRLDKFVEFMLTQPRARLTGDEKNLICDCPRCDQNGSSKPHFSVKADVEPGEPISFQCFRIGCGWKGMINTDILRDEFGCRDRDVLDEIIQHNRTVSGYVEKNFDVRTAREIVIANLPKGNNTDKMKYLQNRLGNKITFEKLSDLKIQLSILDMIRVNDLHKMNMSQSSLRMMDVYCIGFMSMFNDYLICRDITPELRTGMRYYNYRISSKTDTKDVRIYTIPTEVDLLNPRSANINVAEGPFSILGAYLNTDIGKDRPNSIFAANCGAQYENTIIRICKQLGLLQVRINIFSDSEVKRDFYSKLYRSLKNRLDIRAMSVWYNSKAEDFGHRKEDIRPEELTIV